jgi:hypothetical protein
MTDLEGGFGRDCSLKHSPYISPSVSSWPSVVVFLHKNTRLTFGTNHYSFPACTKAKRGPRPCDFKRQESPTRKCCLGVLIAMRFDALLTVTLAFIQDSPVKQPPLWSSGRSSWIQIQRSGFNSRRYQIFRDFQRSYLKGKVAVSV